MVPWPQYLICFVSSLFGRLYDLPTETLLLVLGKKEKGCLIYLRLGLLKNCNLKEEELGFIQKLLALMALSCMQWLEKKLMCCLPGGTR